MRRACQILAGALAVCWLAIISAFSQAIPVTDNLWRLVAQEDTDGDRKITVHDRTTPFAIHDETGVDVSTVTNEYQLSVLMQELKQGVGLVKKLKITPGLFVLLRFAAPFSNSSTNTHSSAST